MFDYDTTRLATTRRARWQHAVNRGLDAQVPQTAPRRQTLIGFRWRLWGRSWRATILLSLRLCWCSRSVTPALLTLYITAGRLAHYLYHHLPIIR